VQNENKKNYRTGLSLVFVSGSGSGESPARIPFQYIDRVRFFINEEAAQKQGIKFPEKIIKRADRLVSTQPRREIPSLAGIGSAE